ncbi:MAG: PTS sugar transporter subunit IIA [Alphaproteobacteria bacterium]
MIQDILVKNSVVCDLVAANKKALLQDLAERAAIAFDQGAHAIFDVLWEREKLGTTGVGHGIAIPHGKIAGLKSVRGYFARLNTAVDFEAIDDKPVDLVFMLLAPTESGADHLRALAQVSRTLRDPQFCDRCRKAKDALTIYNMLISAADHQAA